ncbi:glycosyltransferase [Methyloterricola oryzae]|uniref:glycosyltransferase n=1 Tax=Methyloterricola oryzae TaxID=1495050 RepID=UPI0005EB1526|nr:glycosyltransferase [Methyloterricola oryzae]
MAKIIKVLLVGGAVGTLRTQIVVKYLLDHCDEYAVTFSNDNFYQPRFEQTTRLTRWLGKTLLFLRKPVSLCSLFLKIWFCDVVYLLPMNHGWILRILLANAIWKKPIITDHYISLYETGVDREQYKSPRSLKAMYHRLLDRLGIEQSTRVIYITRDDAVQFSKSVNAKLNPATIRVVPICTAWKPLADPSPSSTFRVCWWGTWIPLHGLENILEAAAILAREGVDFHLELLGTASKARFRYAKLIEELELGQHVAIHCDKTFLDGGLQAYLRDNCDLALGIFGNSPKARRGIPNKIIDAFAMKLPVLAMDTDGCREFIDPQNEMFVSGNHPAEIAEAIRQIINDPVERKRRAERGYERFRQTFTAGAYERQIDAIIREVVTEKAA